MNDFDVATRVAKGVALLDEKKPGWVGLINLDRLELHGTESCILGQVYGDFWDGLAELGFYEEASGLAHNDAAFGFDAHDQAQTRGFEFRALQAEWVRVLTILRQQREAQERETVAA